MKLGSTKLSLIGAAIIVILTAEMQLASAQPAPGQGPPSMRVACGVEMQGLCPGLKGKEARQCLRGHKAQLSAGCAAFMKEAKAKRDAAKTMGSPPAVVAPPSGSDE